MRLHPHEKTKRTDSISTKWSQVGEVKVLWIMESTSWLKNKKTLQRFRKYAVESIMNIAIICVDVRMGRSDIFKLFCSRPHISFNHVSFLCCWIQWEGGREPPLNFQYHTLRQSHKKKKNRDSSTPISRSKNTYLTGKDKAHELSAWLLTVDKTVCWNTKVFFPITKAFTVLWFSDVLTCNKQSNFV